MNNSLQDTEPHQGHVHLAPSFEEPPHLLPVHELEVKLENAKKIESLLISQLDVRLRAEQVAALMIGSLSAFQPGGMLSKQDPIDFNDIRMMTNLNSIAPFCKHYLQHLGNGKDREFLVFPKGTSTYAVEKSDEHLRDKQEEAKCLKRDGNACVLLGTADPKICHIAPFTWNDTEQHAKWTRNLKKNGACFLEPGFHESTKYISNPSELGASDKLWNMICLDPRLHRLWSRGYCGFKFLGIEPVENGEAKVTLQFRWMPQTKKRFGQEMNIRNTGPGNDWDEMVEEINKFHASGNKPPVIGNKIVQVNTRSGTPLLSGHLFHIQMQMGDAARFRDMLEIQWACILVTALSGAAGSPELLSNVDVDGRVMLWIQGQARWEAHQDDLA